MNIDVHLIGPLGGVLAVAAVVRPCVHIEHQAAAAAAVSTRGLLW